MKSRRHVIVVGAGIIGASVAWHLAEAGARVTVLDAQEPGGIATRVSWAWINASFGNPEPYFRLRRHAMQEWHRLAAAVPGVGLARTGSLFWGRPPAELEAFAAEHGAWGYGVRSVSRAEAAAIEPHLVSPPEMAVHVAEEGVVEPLVAAQAILAGAQHLGATVIAHRRVRSLICAGNRVTGVDTDSGLLQADEVVVAGGVGSSRILATADVSLPMRTSPGLVVATAPHPPTLNGLLITPTMELRQTTEGRFLAVGEIEDGQAEGRVDESASELFAAVKGMVDTGSTLAPGTHAVAYRSIPRDGFPAVGRTAGLLGLYAAVTHSGITLAPAIGQFAAEELLTGQRNPLLAPYGMGRFAAQDQSST
ncbi:NAD(P)/FAD-dependent oxidoreductase [Acidisoma sp.]|uniref:NAD(P)/FAD-dependent oxidoreductase n=1 Tax=Acidisoma sp. TaxID=1872115 RepID=UPI003B000401